MGRVKLKATDSAAKSEKRAKLSDVCRKLHLFEGICFVRCYSQASGTKNADMVVNHFIQKRALFSFTISPAT